MILSRIDLCIDVFNFTEKDGLREVLSFSGDGKGDFKLSTSTEIGSLVLDYQLSSFELSISTQIMFSVALEHSFLALVHLPGPLIVLR